MKTVFFLVLLVSFFTKAAFADDLNPVGKSEFQSHVYTDGTGGALPYRLLEPAGYDPAKGPYPLLIFLHGVGERGTENRLQLTHGAAMMRRAAAGHGCFVLAPQCPPEKIWAGRHWEDADHRLTAKSSQPMRLLLGLIGKIEKQYAIDPDRIYVMGLSMGGFGTWDLIQRHSGRFAAAVPICGGGDETLTEPLVGLSIWVFHGDKDAVIPVVRSRDMVEAIRSSGGKPRYTEYPGVGHNSWDSAFAEPKLLDWLCEQRRCEAKKP